MTFVTPICRLIWTSGTAVDGEDPHVDECTGLGGHPARVGIDDGIKFYLAENSCTKNILTITNKTNYESNKVPGKFAFEVDNAASFLVYGEIY